MALNYIFDINVDSQNLKNIESQDYTEDALEPVRCQRPYDMFCTSVQNAKIIFFPNVLLSNQDIYNALIYLSVKSYGTCFDATVTS